MATPTDQTAPVLNICSQVGQLSATLMTTLRALSALEAKRSSAGYTLSSFDSAIDAPTAATRQATGADYQAALTSANAVLTFVNENFHSTNFDKVSP